MRVYAYGARPPIEGADLVEQQFWLAHIYQRVLVLLERRRRDLVERLYRHACPDEWEAYDAAAKAAEAAAQTMRLSRDTGGETLDAEERVERKRLADAAKAALDEARQHEIVVRQAWKTARKRATHCLRPRLKMIDNGVKARQKFAYNAAGSVGLAWGTRLKVGESVERAAEMSAKIGAMPHLPRNDGSGMIVVQLQGDSGIGEKKGLAPKNALGESDTRFRLEYVDAKKWKEVQGRSSVVSRKGVKLLQPKPKSRRTVRRKAEGHYAIAHLRVGSDGRAPIWAKWPVILHRRIPEDAPIKWAQMHARREGPRIRWQLNVTIDLEVRALRSQTTRGKRVPTLAVNLGWRSFEDGGLRVAFAVGSDGHEEEIRVPNDYIDGVEHVASLRSIRDGNFERMKTHLVTWIKKDEERPAWLIEEARYVDRWRRQAKLVHLISMWRSRRFAGDRTEWKNLISWQKQDRHLWFWECDERAKLLRMRRDFYREVAARWATKYARVLVTDMDLRDFATLLPPEEGPKSEGKIPRVLQRLAAPSELRSAMKNACSTRGSFFKEVDGLFKTQTCNACGLVAVVKDLRRRCECGALWDQDANHCRNLLASDKLTPPEKAVGKTGRWQKRLSREDQQAGTTSEVG